MNKPNDTLVADLVIRSLQDAGLDRIHGAPGTVELSLVSSASRQGMQYHFAPHDTVAVGMADGFARATKGIAVANLHCTQGLLNASGFIRVALRDNTPLLILAGLPSTEYDVFEPNHYVRNLEQALTPITKWGWTVTNPGTLQQVLGRAFSSALTPPQGPVFVCIPQDVLETRAEMPARPFIGIQARGLSRSMPARECVERAAKALAVAERPLLFVGYGAQHVLSQTEELAELLGAPVIGEALDRGTQVQNVYCRTNHPFFLGFFDGQDRGILRHLREADAVVFVGTKTTYAKIIGELSANCLCIDMCAEQGEVGAYHHADIGLVGDLEISLGDLANQVAALFQREDAAQRRRKKREEKASELRAFRQKGAAELEAVSMSGEAIAGPQLVKAMAAALPPGTVLVDDSQCMAYYVKRYFPFTEPETLYGSLSSHIGWAMPASLGVKQAKPGVPVVCLVGDSGFLFGMQALAAAARHKVSVLVLVANNGGAVSLIKEATIKWGPEPETTNVLSWDRPGISYAGIAEAMGLRGITVSDAAQLEDAIRSGLEIVTKEETACLVEVRMSTAWEDWDESWYVSGQQPPSTEAPKQEGHT